MTRVFSGRGQLFVDGGGRARAIGELQSAAWGGDELRDSKESHT